MNYDEYISLWLSRQISGNKGIKHIEVSGHVRKYVLSRANMKCEVCEWFGINPFTGLTVLEIHHIDGNYLNSYEDNLQVICPNCHAMTENYRARNKGNGQPYSKKNRKA